MIPENLLQGLLWWTQSSNVLTGVSFLPFSPTLHLFVDASTEGWGAHLGGESAAGLWSNGERQLHINCLEFKAVILAIRFWSRTLRNAQLMIATDNATVASYINKMGGTHSYSLLEMAYEFYDLVDTIPLVARARHIPGATNVLADALSRPFKPSATVWMLNKDVFRWLCQVLGSPNVDLFATSFNHQLQIYVSPVLDPDALSFS